MNIVTVKINGLEYNLRANENEEYLHKLARYVDKKIKNIIEGNSKLSTASASVLTAINSVDEMLKISETYEKALDKSQKLEENEKNLMGEIEALRRQLTHMEQYNAELQDKLKNNRHDEIIKEKDELISRLSREVETNKNICNRVSEENSKLKNDNKELKFQLRTSKTKVLDLQNKLLENQIDLAKVKRKSNPLLKNEE